MHVCLAPLHRCHRIAPTALPSISNLGQRKANDRATMSGWTLHRNLGFPTAVAPGDAFAVPAGHSAPLELERSGTLISQARPVARRSVLFSVTGRQSNNSATAANHESWRVNFSRYAHTRSANGANGNPGAKNAGWEHAGAGGLLPVANPFQPSPERRPPRDPFQFASAELSHGLALHCRTSRDLVADCLRNVPNGDLDRHACSVASAIVICR